jgi:predicted nucleic acid-binding protein
LKPTLVVDANIAVGWSVESPHSPKCVRLLRETGALIAPDLIIPEVTNAFYQQLKSGSANKDRIMDGLEFLPRWFAELVPSASLRSRAFDLALELKHPAYDCFYLALALMRKAKLVTTDTAFQRKAVAQGYGEQVILLEEWPEKTEFSN